MPDYRTGPIGPVFTAPFAAVAISTNPYDMFQLLSSASRLELIELSLTQTSSVVSNDQTLGIAVWRGSTANSSGGAAITPININGSTASQSASAGVTGPSTTLASSASQVLVLAEAFSVRDGFRYRPDPLERPLLNSNQRLHVRMTAPSTAMTFYGTATFRQLPKTTT